MFRKKILLALADQEELFKMMMKMRVDLHEEADANKMVIVIDND